MLLVVVRDHRSLSRYAYTLGLVGIVLVMIPAVLPASLSEVNGAKLWIKFGGFSIQPGEFAKLALLVFFAYYLVRKREVLSLASRRFLGIDFPRGRDLGPVLVVWLLSLLVLVFEKDLGTALLYFGLFVVTLYVATERASWLIIGLLLFFGGAYMAYSLGGDGRRPVRELLRPRVDIWLDPFARPTTRPGYQLVQGAARRWAPAACSAPGRAPASPRTRAGGAAPTSSSPAWARRSACSACPRCSWSTC